MAERDDISEGYAASRRLGACCLILFWSNVAFALGLLLPSDSVAGICGVAQSVTAIAFVALEFLDDYHFWYFAERARRRHLIEDALGVDLTNCSSEGYYNNALPHGGERLAMDAFESIFFTSRIAKAMVPWALAKGLSAALAFVAVVMALPPSSLLPVVTQTVFSSYLLVGTAKVFVYSGKLEQLYDGMYRACVTAGAESRSEIARVLVDVEEYECLKAHFRVRLSGRLYNKLNLELSKEWARIAEKAQVGRLPTSESQN